MRTHRQVTDDIVTLAYRMAGTFEAMKGCVATYPTIWEERAAEYGAELYKLHAERIAATEAAKEDK